jgi:hypothetical protein
MTPVNPTTTPGVAIPPLKEGDRLSREEFERRYDAMPELKRAELINGVVLMPSPVRHEQHGNPHAYLTAWLVCYEMNTPGTSIGDNSTIRLDGDNEPQPDDTLLIKPGWGGNARIDSEGYIEGGPELVAEVAASSVNIDLTSKLQVYSQHGVREYLVWRVLDQAVDWFVLRQGQYDRLAPTSGGVLQSEVFPGLWLDVAALVRLEVPAVMQQLQQGLASPDHAAFVTRLQQQHTGQP